MTPGRRRLTRELAEHYAAVALGNVVTEFPNAPQHVVTAVDETTRPQSLHPAFYGSFDWHSCVHMHWLLVRLLREFPELSHATAIRAALDAHLTVDNLAVEADYLGSHPTFERPYGWAWALRLAIELEAFPEWRAAFQPLATAVVERYLDWLPRATYPVRHGVHSNSAFGLLLPWGYADPALRTATEAAARRWFLTDHEYPAAWEPSGEDFLSPALVEAALMGEVLGDEFPVWFSDFLPQLPQLPQALGEPAVVADRSDYRIVHLDGLNLSRAWCFRLLAARFHDVQPAVAAALEAAGAAHLQAALPHVASGGYGGDHWLASFAVLALIS